MMCGLLTVAEFLPQAFESSTAVVQTEFLPTIVTLLSEKLQNNEEGTLGLFFSRVFLSLFVIR